MNVLGRALLVPTALAGCITGASMDAPRPSPTTAQVWTVSDSTGRVVLTDCSNTPACKMPVRVPAGTEIEVKVAVLTSDASYGGPTSCADFVHPEIEAQPDYAAYSVEGPDAPADLLGSSLLPPLGAGNTAAGVSVRLRVRHTGLVRLVPANRSADIPFLFVETPDQTCAPRSTFPDPLPAGCEAVVCGGVADAGAGAADGGP